MITIELNHTNGVNVLTVTKGNERLLWSVYRHTPVVYGFAKAEVEKIEKILRFTGQDFETKINAVKPIKI